MAQHGTVTDTVSFRYLIFSFSWFSKSYFQCVLLVEGWTYRSTEQNREPKTRIKMFPIDFRQRYNSNLRDER